MWLGEQITERGIGNGMSLIIFVGIIVGLPRAIADIYQNTFVTHQWNALQMMIILAVMIAVGATIVPFPRVSVEAWQELGRHGVTHAFLVPTMIERLLDAGALALPGLRLLQYGAAPIRPAALSGAVARPSHPFPNAARSAASSRAASRSRSVAS